MRLEIVITKKDIRYHTDEDRVELLSCCPFSELGSIKAEITIKL